MIEHGHNTPEQMAYTLVGYIRCDDRIWREIRTEFNSPQITRSRIAKIREMRQRQEAQAKRGKWAPHCDDGDLWKHGAADLEQPSRDLLAAIRSARGTG